MNCQCHDGFVCDACAAAQIEQSFALQSDKPVLTTEQVDALITQTNAWLNSLQKGQSA